MEKLIVNNNKKLNTGNWVRIGDLSYFEGPILSLFEELNSGYLYLFDWVDRDMKANRWIIYRVHPKYLLDYLNGKISHLELFNNKPNNSVFFTDIDSQNRPFYHYDAFELNEIPESYLPNSDNFFDLSDCNSFEKIKSVIISSYSRQKSENEYSTSVIAIGQKFSFDTTGYLNKGHDMRIVSKTMYNNFNKEVIKEKGEFFSNSLSLLYSTTAMSNSQKSEIKKSKKYENQYSPRLPKKSELAVH